jgi:penicillin-binding protein 1C
MKWLKRSITSIILLVLVLLTGYLCLPKPTLLSSIPFSQAIYDEHHQLLYLTRASDGQYRLFTALKNISPNLIQATLLQEDRYYYDHPAINPFTLIRAAFDTYILRKRRYGGSTITMQVARLRFHIKSNTVLGKLEQIFCAFQLQRHYSKKQILEAYLNLAPYGGNIVGAGAASLIYFQQDSKFLTLPQAITLSVIPQNPIKRHPYNNNKILITARNNLFQRWASIHPQDKSQTYLFSLPFAINTEQQLPFLTPHFTRYVIKHSNSNKTIITTLDLPLQKQLHTIMTNYLQQASRQNIHNAAALLIDNKSMTIKSYIGSGDFFDKSIEGQVDGIVAYRSPGSALKPFIYALAIEQGLITPMSIVKDIPQNFSGYSPQDFDSQYLGPITAQQALILSRNIPAVNLESQLNSNNLYNLLQLIHIPLKPEKNYGLSIALGGADITMLKLGELYAALANKGIYQTASFIKNSNSHQQKLLSPSASFITLDMLRHNPALIKESALPIAWKTGTSAGFSDAWAVGDFGHYTLVVWLGNFNGRGNPALVGLTAAAPLFFQMVHYIQQQQHMTHTRGLSHHNLPVIRIKVCRASGLLATPICPDKIKTWFIPGVSPIKKDSIYRLIAINPKTDLRTCHINKHTQFKAYAFWPSDFEQAFIVAGLPRQQPPAFEKGCEFADSTGLAPHITAPIANVTYDISQHPTIALSATADASSHKLFWFINNIFIGKSEPNEVLTWNARPGKFLLTVVDEQGHSARQNIRITQSKIL